MKDRAQAWNAADDAPTDAASGLIQLSGLVQYLYARISERHELTPVQARLLCMLAEGPKGMAELARCFGVEKAALTGLVDRVERRGLAKRTPVHGDRRALHVTLTEAGRRTAAAFHGEVTAELESLLSALAPDDREHFRRAMVAIIAACGAGGPRGVSYRIKPLRNSSSAPSEITGIPGS
ncbi:MAG TPA: MarR family transcriptional regulator [Propionibacteriaceae bacterium]